MRLRRCKSPSVVSRSPPYELGGFDRGSGGVGTMADLDKLAQEEVLRRLGTDETTGLTEEEAARRLQVYGPNFVVHRPQHAVMVDGKLGATLKSILLLWGWDHSFNEYIKYSIGWESWKQLIFPWSKTMICVMLINLLSWTAMVAATASLVINSAGQAPYELAIVRTLLLGSLSACCVAKLLANHAKAPVEAKAFTPMVKVLRGGIWKDERATSLVPGDIIYLKCGDIVPANAHVLNLASIDTKILRDERCVDCVNGALIYYGWSVSCGEGTAVVTATGNGIPRSTLKLYPKRFSRPGQLRKGVMAAGSFCFCLVLVGIIAEALVTFLFLPSVGKLRSGHFMPLIGLIPMALPAVLYLVLALGSRRLSKLGIASRGTVALEDLTSMDATLFNMTGTLTCNKPCFDKDKVEVYAEGIDENHAILLAARASKAHNELYVEPTDAATLGLMDDPEQVRVSIKVIEHRSRIFVAMTSMKMAPSALCSKVILHCVVRQCSCSKEVKEHVLTRIDKLGRDGYKSLAVGRIVNSRLDIVGILPFIDDLRSDNAEAVDNLTDMGLSVIVLTESPMAITEHVCGRLGKLGLNVLHANSMRELVHNKSELFLNINGISDLFIEYNHAESICESDLVLTGHALLSVHTVSSTLHAVVVRLILLLWRLELSCFPALVVAACNYCTSTAMLFERVKSSKSPDRLKAKAIIGTGAAFGSYVALSTVLFFIIATRTDFIHHIFKARSLIGHDKEIRSALFLQMSMINHAIGLFAQSCSGHLTYCPGPLVTISFVLSQLVATVVAVYGDVNFAQLKGVGWGWAGFIWFYSLVLLLALVLILVTCVTLESSK
ncbi:hypothetical protein ACP70R_000611 [Stipagrostis hirtigluma subsp. patula]